MREDAVRPRLARTKLPEIPCRSVVGSRSLAVHEYFGLDFDIVWTTATEQVPVLGLAIAPFQTQHPD